MPRIFGRNTLRPHAALAPVLAEMLVAKEESERALAWNLIHDDRISEDRADHFYEFTNHPSTPAELLSALRKYVASFIHVEDPIETYLNSQNSCNFLSLNPKPAFDLCHLVNLSAVLYQLRNTIIDPTFGIGLDLFDNAETQISNARDPQDIQSLVDHLLSAYFILRRSRPIWAAKWNDLARQNLADQGGKSWNQAVGVWREFDTIQLTVRYSARKPTRLVRPTQLDIGAFQYHFPSPASADVKLGGFCMLLKEMEPRRRQRLVSEFIHPPFPFSSKHWLRSGARIVLVKAEGAGTVEGYRRQHLERLKATVPGTTAWNLGC